MTSVKFKITGMHCTSCAFNIDGELEDTKGVKEANTSYTKQVTEVAYDESLITPQKIGDIIKTLGYDTQVVN